MSKIQRNDPCICGSGKKYKKCCLHKKNAEQDTPSQAAPAPTSKTSTRKTKPRHHHNKTAGTTHGTPQRAAGKIMRRPPTSSGK